MTVEQQGLLAIFRLICQAMGNMLQQNETFANSVMEMEKKIAKLEEQLHGGTAE